MDRRNFIVRSAGALATVGLGASLVAKKLETRQAAEASVNAKAGEPEISALGAIDVTAGTGLLIVKVSGLEVPPPGARFETVMEAVPAVAISAAVIVA